MLTFTVHEPPNPPVDAVDRAESLVFIKDGFSWAAALFAPIWLIAHRLWWALLGFVLLSGSFEADPLRRWALERRGWRMLGTVTGKTAAECERRFFETWLPSQPIIAPRTDPRPPRDSRWRMGGLVGARS